MMTLCLNIKIIFCHSQSCHLDRILFLDAAIDQTAHSTCTNARWPFEALRFGSPSGARNGPTIKLN